MAIQSVYQSLEFGLQASQAYTKLNKFIVDNTIKDTISIFTESYFNQNARLDSKKPIGINEYQMPWIEAFTFADIYAFIKEQAEFAGAIDVI